VVKLPAAAVDEPALLAPLLQACMAAVWEVGFGLPTKEDRRAAVVQQVEQVLPAGSGWQRSNQTSVYPGSTAWCCTLSR
jgi:hypothetical protein